MEEKRRLPSWMTSSSTTNKVSKTLEIVANDIINNEEVDVDTKFTKPKAKSLTRKNKKEVFPSSDNKSLLVKCETKRKKRKTVEKDAIEVVDEKKKLPRVRKKVEEPDNSGKKEQNKSQSSDEDDEDLTMEDLLTIAKQFVENDKSDSGQQKSSHSSSSMNKSPIKKQTSLHHESTENTTSEITLEGITMTGDPAQDMLDLFLGPLLKKPIRKEENNLINDMIVTNEVKSQRHDAVVVKPVNLTKKKSSLRDAVAMLLE